MFYVISDLHGYPLIKFQQLRAKAGFCRSDVLFILGDVIDRNGDGGVEMLNWLRKQNNIQLILGNHEAMLLSVLDAPGDERKERLINYQASGGDVTLDALADLKAKSREDVDAIEIYLRNSPLYRVVTVGNDKYLLLHGGLDTFRKHKRPSDYSPDEILWAWPEINDVYYDDMVTIFGHTPTMSYGEGYRGKILKTRTWIDIDVGAGYGMEPVLLRLDDMQEFQNIP